MTVASPYGTIIWRQGQQRRDRLIAYEEGSANCSGSTYSDFRIRENVQCANDCYSVSVSSARQWFSLLWL